MACGLQGRPSIQPLSKGNIVQTWASVQAAARNVRRSIRFSALVVFVFALAMGGAIAGFSAVKALLLEPLPYRDADRLVRVGHTHTQRGRVFEGTYSPQDADDLARATKSFEAFAPFHWQPGQSTESATINELPHQLQVTYVDPRFFETLGGGTAIGRTLADGELDTVVLSNRLWRVHFAGDPGIVGRTITTTGGTLRVVGVLPAAFEYPSAEVDAYLSLHRIGEDDIPKQRDVRWLGVVARLKPGVTIDAAQAEADAVIGRLAKEYGESNKDFERAAIEPISTQIVANERAPVLALFVATLLVLAIASVNVANLMIARGARRARELAVRAALGASRRTLALQVVGESVVLSIAGAVGGLLLAMFALNAFAHVTAGRIARLSQIEIDPLVVIAAVAMALLTGVLVGAWPAFRSARTDAAASLGRATVGSQHRGEARLRGALVVAQIALVGGLGYAASLLGTSLSKLSTVDLGIQSDNLITLATDGGKRKEILAAIRAIPGVRSASSSKTAVIGESGERYGVALPSDPEHVLPLDWGTPFVSPDFFKTLGVPLLRGREFTETETTKPFLPLIVNQAFVDRYLGGRDPIGTDLVFAGKAAAQIVGLVGNVRHAGPRMPEAPVVYLPSSILERSHVTTIVRAEAHSPALFDAIRAAIWSVDASRPVTQMKWMDDHVAALDERAYWLSRALSAFTVFGCILGAIGVFSVLSYVVALRSRELALKLAVGARPSTLARGVLAQSARYALLGSLIAIPLGVGAARVIGSMLHGVEPATPLMLALMVGGVVLLAMAAGAMPALRAARTEPMTALRAE